jgi:transcriptional regulator with XRE-family HTH domain
MGVREFAARLGVSDRTVSKWEARSSGVHPRPVWQAALDTVAQQASDEERARFELLLAVPADQAASVETAVAFDGRLLAAAARRVRR